MKYRPLSGLYWMSIAMEALGSLGLGPYVNSGMSMSGLMELQVDMWEMDT